MTESIPVVEMFCRSDRSNDVALLMGLLMISTVRVVNKHGGFEICATQDGGRRVPKAS